MEITAGDVTLNFILDERGREFCGGSKRWTTLKRMGKLIEPVHRYTGLQETRDIIDQRFLLGPIQAEQITRTDGEYPQNPGY